MSSAELVKIQDKQIAALAEANRKLKEELAALREENERLKTSHKELVEAARKVREANHTPDLGYSEANHKLVYDSIKILEEALERAEGILKEESDNNK